MAIDFKGVRARENCSAPSVSLMT